jgi:ligand-binding sensor domain-containing protein
LLRTTLYCLIFLFSLHVAAQEEKQYSFKHLGESDGLASNEATSVIQDEKGYIWIATNNGLQRFDGIRYKTFRNIKNDPTSIPNNYVIQILLDKKNNLWVLTGDGKIGILDTKRFRYQEVKVRVESEYVLRAERGLMADEDGNLILVYHNHYVATWNEQKREFSSKYNFIDFPADWRVLEIRHQPGTKKYWVSTQKGMAIYNAQTKNLNYTGHNVDKEVFIEKLGTITAPGHIFFDKQGRIWFDIWKGSSVIFLYDLIRNQTILSHFGFSRLGVYHEVRGFLQQKDGTIWLKGLAIFAKYDEQTRNFNFISTVYHNERSINYDRVNDFFEDRERNVWIATNNNGVYRFDPASQFFVNIRHVIRGTGKYGKGSVMSFIEDRKGNMLTGVWSDGLYRYDSNLKTKPLNIRGIVEKDSPWIWSMSYSADSSTLWMGAQPGIYEVNTRTMSSVSRNHPLFKNSTVRQVLADKYGNLWIGVQNRGLFKWTASKGKRKWEDGINRIQDVPNNTVFKLLIDNDGLLWVCTGGFGVYIFDPSTDSLIQHLGTKEPIGQRMSWEAATTVVQYNDSIMAILAQGVYLYNTRQRKIVKYIKTPQSIPSFLTSAEKDCNGYLWISSSNGMLRLNPQNEIFIHFDRRDGIANDRFVETASYVKKDGTLIFGADDQFVVFDPKQVRINDATPPVTITDFKVMNRSLLVDSLMNRSQIELSPGQNSITIEFSGLHYDGAYLIKYKLDGLDKDWIIADINNQAIYSYLPPGKYTFTALSEDAEGKRGKTETKLVIRINPPFWQTWWFYCLLALAAVTLLYLIDRERMKRLRELQRVRSQIAANLHEKVNTTLNNINLLSEMAKIKADKDIEQSKEYIDRISTKSHNMIIAMDDILWSINPENDTMEKTLLRMMEFTDALKNRYGTNIDLVLDKKVRSLNLDMKIRHEFFLIFKEALRMIVQYSGGKETLINIDFFQNKLSMKLQDETASFDTNIMEIERSIKEMNSRAALIPAELDIQYDKKGIAVILMLPAK